MTWIMRNDVVDYILESYQPDKQGRKRQFIWETSDGDIVIGNTRAFADHLYARYQKAPNKTGWMEVHRVLRACGDQLFQKHPRSSPRHKPFINQEPDFRVLVKNSNRE